MENLRDKLSQWASNKKCVREDFNHLSTQNDYIAFIMISLVKTPHRQLFTIFLPGPAQPLSVSIMQTRGHGGCFNLQDSLF